jgi:hypothetical protein
LIFTVHHTCSQKGGKEFVLANAPFLSEYIPKYDKKPFLGEGYYFWEYNIDYAKYWGFKHYKNSKYFVCEADIDIDHETDGYYLDLAGNRKHLVGFVELLKEFDLIHEEGTKGIDLCYIINYLRKNVPKEIFPFKVLRAVDYKNTEKEGIKIFFNDKKSVNSFTILNPRMLISFKRKEDIVYLKKPFITFAS